MWYLLLTGFVKLGSYLQIIEMVDVGNVPGRFHMRSCSVPASRLGLVCPRLGRKRLPGEKPYYGGEGQGWKRKDGESKDTSELVVFLR